MFFYWKKTHQTRHNVILWKHAQTMEYPKSNSLSIDVLLVEQMGRVFQRQRRFPSHTQLPNNIQLRKINIHYPQTSNLPSHGILLIDQLYISIRHHEPPPRWVFCFLRMPPAQLAKLQYGAKLRRRHLLQGGRQLPLRPADGHQLDRRGGCSIGSEAGVHQRDWHLLRRLLGRAELPRVQQLLQLGVQADNVRLCGSDVDFNISRDETPDWSFEIILLLAECWWAGDLIGHGLTSNVGSIPSTSNKIARLCH